MTIAPRIEYLNLSRVLSFSLTLKKPSKNYTCFILRRFGLFLIYLQSKKKLSEDGLQLIRNFFYTKWIKNNPKRLKINMHGFLKTFLALMKLLSLSQFYVPRF